MQITDGVEMLELAVNILGKTHVVYPTLIKDKDTIILVDAGYPMQLPQIRKSLDLAGIPFTKLKAVILTHHDLDHLGSVPEIIHELKVDVLAHKIEKRYIEGKLSPLRLEQLEANPKIPEQAIEYINNFFALNKIKVTQTLTDGEILPYCGGITVVHTPGHTKGHISLYLNKSKILIPGDALVLEKGILTLAANYTNYNTELCIKSLWKLLKYDIEAIICYHGGLYKGNVKQRIVELAFNEQPNELIDDMGYSSDFGPEYFRRKFQKRI